MVARDTRSIAAASPVVRKDALLLLLCIVFVG